jgi:hypothetical protein
MSQVTIVAVAIVAIFLVIAWMARNKAEYQLAVPRIIYFTDGKCEGCDKMELQVRQRFHEKGAVVAVPGDALYTQHIQPGDELPQLIYNEKLYKGLREVQQQILDYRH